MILKSDIWQIFDNDFKKWYLTYIYNIRLILISDIWQKSDSKRWSERPSSSRGAGEGRFEPQVSPVGHQWPQQYKTNERLPAEHLWWIGCSSQQCWYIVEGVQVVAKLLKPFLFSVKCVSTRRNKLLWTILYSIEDKKLKK